MSKTTKVERFLTFKGFEYKSDITTTVIKANYTYGLTLRKIYAVDGNNLCIYTLKQEDILKKLFYDIFWLLYRPTAIPIYYLYKNNVRIGQNEDYKDSMVVFKIKGYDDFKLVYSFGKKNRKVEIVENNTVKAEIIRSRLRFWKKNIYTVIYDNWDHSNDLLLLLTAFCDIVFFPEWHLTSISAMEYDLFEIDFSKIGQGKNI